MICAQDIIFQQIFDCPESDSAERKILSAYRSVDPESEAGSGCFLGQMLAAQIFRCNVGKRCAPCITTRRARRLRGLEIRAPRALLPAARVVSFLRTPARCRSRGADLRARVRPPVRQVPAGRGRRPPARQLCPQSEEGASQRLSWGTSSAVF